MKCFQLCFPVLISSSLSLITPAFCSFPAGDKGMCRSVWWCVTWVGWVQQGEDEWGEKPPATWEGWALSPDPQPPSLALSRRADPAVVLPFQQPGAALLGWMVNVLHQVTQAMLPTGRWIPAFPLTHHPHKALMTLQVILHSQRFSDPHAWLQKDASPKAGCPFQLPPACFRVWAPLVPSGADMVPELLNGVESERTMAVTGLSQGSTPVLGASPSAYHKRNLLDSPAVSPPSPGWPEPASTQP